MKIGDYVVNKPDVRNPYSLTNSDKVFNKLKILDMDRYGIKIALVYDERYTKDKDGDDIELVAFTHGYWVHKCYFIVGKKRILIKKVV